MIYRLSRESHLVETHNVSQQTRKYITALRCFPNNFPKCRIFRVPKIDFKSENCALISQRRKCERSMPRLIYVFMRSAMYQIIFFCFVILDWVNKKQNVILYSLLCASVLLFDYN